MILPLHLLAPGESARVVELRSSNAARLDRLGALGIVPGSLIVVQQMHPAFVLRAGETEISLDLEVAREIMVTRG